MTPADMTLASEAWERILRRVRSGEPLVRLTREEVLAIDATMLEVLAEVTELRVRVGDVAPEGPQPPALHLAASNGEGQ